MKQQKSNLIILSAAVLVLALILVPATYYSDAYIPPTRAFQKIWVGSNNVSANSYNSNVTFTAGNNMQIQTYFANNTLRFTSSAASIAMEQLSNVTAWGCALGQARVVGPLATWVCSNVGTGDITGAANVGGATGNIFRDETSGTLNFKTLSGSGGITITNNADTVDIASSGGGGNATSLKDLGDVSNQINATKGNVFVANGTHWNGIKVGSDNQVLTADSSRTFGVKWATPATGSTLRVDNQTATQRDFFLIGLNNATGDWTRKQFSIDNKTTSGGDVFVYGINNVTGAISSKQFSVNTQTCSAGQYVDAIDNSTGQVICDSVTVSGGATSLGANVTATVGPTRDTLIFTIPLTANSGNTISGVITATSSVSGTAVQASANVTNLNTRGYCKWVSVSTTTADAVDNIVMNTILTGRATNTGETAWIAAANTPMPINFDCSLVSGATAGNMRIFMTPEVAGATIQAKAGSYYIKTP